MNEQIRKQLSAVPFRPFWLETVGGNRIAVQKPEWFHEFDSENFVVFGDGVTYILRWKDVLDSIAVEQPPTEE